LDKCTCHWCRNRRRLLHNGCELCDDNTVKEEDNIIYLSEEDEEEIKKLPLIDDEKIEDDNDDTLPLDSKKGWKTYTGYYYNEEVDLHHPYCSWEEVPLKPGEVLIHFWNYRSHPTSGSEGTDNPEISGSDPEKLAGSTEKSGDVPETLAANQTQGYEVTRPSDRQSGDQEKCAWKRINIYLPSFQEVSQRTTHSTSDKIGDAGSIPWTPTTSDGNGSGRGDEIGDFGSENGEKQGKGENSKEDTLSQLSSALTDARNDNRRRYYEYRSRQNRRETRKTGETAFPQEKHEIQWNAAAAPSKNIYKTNSNTYLNQKGKGRATYTPEHTPEPSQISEFAWRNCDTSPNEIRDAEAKFPYKNQENNGHESSAPSENNRNNFNGKNSQHSQPENNINNSNIINGLDLSILNLVHCTRL
jgi:hypothetical protein